MNFLPNHEVIPFIFTDAPKEKIPVGCSHIVIQHEQWPGPTLHRFSTMLKAKFWLIEYDYICYVDADSTFVGQVNERDAFNDLSFVKFPRPETASWPFGWELNENSVAYLPESERHHYVSGHFSMGAKDKYLDYLIKCEAWQKTDEAAGLIPKFNDEAYSNFYAAQNPFYLLPSGYCSVPCWGEKNPISMCEKKDVREIDELRGVPKKT